ncbi:copper amine oxidase N-terminal domain-containing protein [Paenibacillus sp. WLX2291]|uniref:copper amine oxidase N-terminal domain-containing protein n=1 Tax=Paenibacillus sp. WLX2291 TaxID=3296934 RepID=UPI0039840910
MYKKIISSFLLTSALLTSAVPPSMTHAASAPITSYDFAGERNLFHYARTQTSDLFIVRSGITYIDIGFFYTNDPGLTLTWDKSQMRAGFQGFNKKIAVRMGSRTAMLDGKKVTLPAAPFKQSNHNSGDIAIYVPVRFALQAIGGGNIQVDAANHRITADHVQSYTVLTDVYGDSTYTLKKQTGDLFVSRGSSLPVLIASIDTQLTTAQIQVSHTSGGLQVIRIRDNYGEPGINTQDFTLIFKKDALIRQAHMQYFWEHGSNIETYNNNIVLSDGATLRIISGETGNVLETIDLIKLGGKKATYVVEAIQPAFILVRNTDDAHLMLVHRQTGESIVLYQNLLTPEQQRLVEPLITPWAQGDEITFDHRTGQTLYFTYAKGTDREQELTYTLSTETPN